MRTSPARGAGSGTLSYLSTSGGPNSWMTIAFMRFLCLENVNHLSASRTLRQDTPPELDAETSIDLHAGFAHDALPFDGVGLDEVAEFGRGHAGGIDEVGVEPLPGVRIVGEITHIAIELVDDILRRAARREQREPGRGLETGKSLLGERGHVGQIGRASGRGGAEDAQLALADELDV